ncbi:hypothetical protein EPUS_01255 [Endocarpon pusillum Z07020]|uniref:Impact N-terminal domain-containing protein n=1 Tax=Endocarpon pusillum (strain Z07020 / HMAS-L-300199) TaxID=1263415 RepID=U1I1S4_ENDPU|nr:uncharacterized protein EPUS_01255 [Endocarpon pusillum Z07020]ERF75889.1 hypothetical protein EPUS_01255 [Endocarpon pusillum Z07020]
MSQQHGARIVANAALSEEIDAINAIYGSNVAAPVGGGSSSSSSSNNNRSNDNPDHHLVLQIPGQSVSFLLSFRADYPDTCPRADGTHSTGKLGKKGSGQHAVTLVQQTLSSVWTRGSPAEESVARLPAAEEQAARTGLTSDAARIPGSEWSVSDPITEKKSVFVARCASVAGKGAAASALAELLATNKKVAAATHNISAWRVRDGETGVTVQDCDDDADGCVECGRGGDEVWYGGVKLGADRFRLINQAAREALLRGGFVKVEKEEEEEEKKGGKKRGKK